MAAPGVELLVAAHRDGVVPSLVIALGGVWVELLDDAAVLPLPATPERVEQALLGLRAAPLLTGVRGSESIDLRALATLAARVGDVLLEHDLQLLELNPVLAGPRGAVAVDAVARTTTSTPSPR
jgi:succinyl-CoA synthetase beta subunit